MQGARQSCLFVMSERFGKPGHQPHQVFNILLFPCIEDRSAHPLTRRIEFVGHALSLGRDDCFANSSVGNAPLASHETQAIELADLTTDRRVIQPDALGQINDTDWPQSFDRDRKAKQRAVQRYAGFTHELVVARSDDDARGDGAGAR